MSHFHIKLGYLAVLGMTFPQQQLFRREPCPSVFQQHLGRLTSELVTL